MTRYIVSGDSYGAKFGIKEITTGRYWWKHEKGLWILTVRDQNATKKLQKRIEEFIARVGCSLSLSAKEWDGTNKNNNYV